MWKKLRSTRGESLSETLAAMLVIALGLTMLAGAIVTSARVNQTAAGLVTLVEPPPASGEGAASAPTPDPVDVSVKNNSDNTSSVYKVIPYGEGGLFYYEYKKSG